MTLLKLTLRSALYYRKAHVLVLAGTLLSTAILVGALLVGDSVKFSLMQSALLRLGNIQWALETRGRLFPADLADRLREETGVLTTPALLFHGIAMTSSGRDTQDRQINNIQILGVPDSFWSFAEGSKPPLTEEGIAINQQLATELHLQRGDQVSIRFSKPSLMSRDAPLSSQEKNDTLRATFTVDSIVANDQLGRFNLAANQQIPGTAFVSLSKLQGIAGSSHQANLLLAGGSTNQSPEFLNQAIQRIWRLEDAGLTLRTIDNGRLFQLECSRIFIDPSVSPAVSDLGNPVGALTYLVNSIARTNGTPLRETPYSFVIALSPAADASLGLVPPDMKDDEIIINQWLSDHLAATPGDALRITYFELSALNTFVEKNRIFKIRAVKEMSEFARERELAPNFPGLTDAGKCSEWDIGMPLNKNTLEDPANEAYWNDFRATPKAIVTLKAGQKMWANRFGKLTAIRFRANEDGADAITEVLLQHLKPTELGLAFLPVRQSALNAARESMDLGQLFLGMSFFLIVASLMLTGLLLAFGIQQRSEETGVLLAVGFKPKQIRRLWIQECVLISALGAGAGALLGSCYTRILIWSLNHFWQGAVARADIQYHATYTTIVSGAILSFAFSMGALIFTIHRQTKKPAQGLFSGETAPFPESNPTPFRKRSLLRLVLVIAPFIFALALIGYAAVTPSLNPAPIFFVAGTLLLTSLLGATWLLLLRLARAGGRFTLLSLGLRNAGRHPSRSLTVASLMACGCFLMLAVSAMQEDFERTADQRDSGTGGFALFGDSTLPVQADLTSQEGRGKINLDQDPAVKATRIVAMKVRDGDDASCLNLNHAQSPTLVGVNPDEFETRGAFLSPALKGSLWPLLNESLPDGSIPGLVGDANTAQWGLKKKTGKEQGDILVLRDERGEPFRIKLVGTLPPRLSVFQGSILISAQAFASHYPSENGTRMFLIEPPAGATTRVKDALSLKLGKQGINIISTTDRLNYFYSVEATYMNIFLILGGLGMLLGSAGMTVVILRHIQERRNELAILTATGFTEKQVRIVILAEQGVILGAGMAVGIIASLVAIWPGLQAPGIHLPWAAMTGLICGMVLFQIVWILIAIRIALRTPLQEALRNA